MHFHIFTQLRTYFYVGNDIPGSFDNAKATQLGVPNGSIRKELVNGNDITLANGTVIHAKDVMTSSTRGPVIVVVECPDVSYVESLGSTGFYIKLRIEYTYTNIYMINIYMYIQIYKIYTCIQVHITYYIVYVYKFLLNTYIYI